MAIFRPKPWDQKSIFPTFWTSFIYSLERRFFVLEYRKRHFRGLYCLKQKGGKMFIFGPKPWVNPFGKMSIFPTFWTSFIYSLENRFFVLEYPKRHFRGPYCLKQKAGKMAVLEPKSWVNPLGKIAIFWRFELLLFIAKKPFFRSRIS